MDTARTRRWRTGRHVGRTIYGQAGNEPSDDDTLIGVMDSPELAAEACRCHNALLGGGSMGRGGCGSSPTITVPYGGGSGTGGTGAAG